MATKSRLIDKLTTAKGWSVKEKYPYVLKDGTGEVIETLYLKPLSRSSHKKISEAIANGGGDNSTLATRMLVESAYLANGDKAFDVSDIPTLQREISASQLNDMEMAVLNAGRDLDVEAEKKDLETTD